MIKNENLKVVAQVARLGSLQAAADEMGYTHAGVSYIVNTVEKTLGVNLFHRHHGGISLTADGEALLPWIAQMQASEDALLERARELQNLNAGKIRIVTFNSASVHILPDIIARFKAKYPDINVEFIFTEDDIHARQLVMSGQADCGFFVRMDGDQYVGFDVAQVQLVAMVSPDHPLAGRKKFPVKQLDRYPYISPLAPKEDAWIRDFLQLHDANPEIAFRVANDYCAMALVSKGLGYCIYPEILAEKTSLPIVCLPFDKPEIWNICIGVKSLDTCTHSTREFIRIATG